LNQNYRAQGDCTASIGQSPPLRHEWTPAETVGANEAPGNAPTTVATRRPPSPAAANRDRAGATTTPAPVTVSPRVPNATGIRPVTISATVLRPQRNIQASTPRAPPGKPHRPLLLRGTKRPRRRSTRSRLGRPAGTAAGRQSHARSPRQLRERDRQRQLRPKIAERASGESRTLPHSPDERPSCSQEGRGPVIRTSCDGPGRATWRCAARPRRRGRRLRRDRGSRAPVLGACRVGAARSAARRRVR
jgi:hypothetical protein